MKSVNFGAVDALDDLRAMEVVGFRTCDAGWTRDRCRVRNDL